MNSITPTRSTWNGMNSSGWRKDLLETRGFDERMAYGGEDREMGDRLLNADIRSRQIRYSAITLHLDHSRPYKNKEAMEKNHRIRIDTLTQKRTYTEIGL